MLACLFSLISREKCKRFWVLFSLWGGVGSEGGFKQHRICFYTYFGGGKLLWRSFFYFLLFCSRNSYHIIYSIWHKTVDILVWSQNSVKKRVKSWRKMLNLWSRNFEVKVEINPTTPFLYSNLHFRKRRRHCEEIVKIKTDEEIEKLDKSTQLPPHRFQRERGVGWK